MPALFDLLRDFALAFEGAYEDHPFGEESNVFKAANGKMFVISSKGANGALRASLKLAPDEALAALSLPFVSPAPYLARHSWVQSVCTTETELEITLEWVSHSHQLVAAGARRKAGRVR